MISKDKKQPKNYDYNKLSTLVEQVAHDAFFDLLNFYEGSLGADYSEEVTEFKLWAPTASQVELLIYDHYYGNINRSILMQRTAGEQIFSLKLAGDHHGLTYRYRLTFLDGRINETIDPYAKAVTVNGQRGVVVDLQKTNPSNWKERKIIKEDSSQAIIYELHMRDFTIANNSGVKHKGKFLGATERNTTNTFGSPTGLDYLTSLGVTHVEFMPLFDYQTVDETAEPLKEYNWGYDPQNYNAPEGSYATNVYDPMIRIREMKEMIQTFHDAGLKVIMDVVYNHVYQVENHSFHQTVPGYYFRLDENGQYFNGTGVGNDTASEKYMMKKYIIDSVVYWAQEYHIDGFRFDLMGIHDTNTMNAVRNALDKIDPNILLFGEGWDLYTPLQKEEAANHNNAILMPRIGQFNAGIRNALKGNDFDPKARGFINGAWNMEQSLAQNILGGVDFGSYQDPQQLIQFVEAHDNYTLYDRLITADPELDEATIVKRQELATTIILLSQGIPFIHAGQEFLRSKKGVRDSYNKSDEINQIDWDRQEKYRHSVNLLKNLIKLRKAEPLFRMKSYEEILQRVEVWRTDYQIVELIIQGEGYRLLIAFNAQSNPLTVPLFEGDYVIKLHNGEVYLDDELRTGRIDEITMEAYTALVLKQYE